MGVVHPAVPGEKVLQDVSHDEDDGHPKPCANQYAPHHTLAVFRHVLTAERENHIVRAIHTGKDKNKDDYEKPSILTNNNECQ